MSTSTEIEQLEKQLKTAEVMLSIAKMSDNDTAEHEAEIAEINAKIRNWYFGEALNDIENNPLPDSN